MSNPFEHRGDLDVGCNYNVGGMVATLAPDGSGNASINLPVKWGTFKVVELFFAADYKLMGGNKWLNISMPPLGAGSMHFSARWVASFTDSGLELTQDGVQPKTYGTNTNVGNIIVGASARLGESKPGAQTPFVEMAVALVAGDEDSGIQFGLGPVGKTVGASKSGQQVEYTFRINFETVRPVTPVVAAPVAVPKIAPSLLAPAPILFNEDQDTLSAQGAHELHEWVSKLKDHEYLGTVIANGSVPLEIQAFASTTGTPKYNKGETDRRLKSVETILKNSVYFASEALKFDEKSHGMEKADGVGPANAFNRRVEIKIDNAKATKAGAALLQNGKKPASSKVAVNGGGSALRNFWSNVVGQGQGGNG